MSDTEEVVIKRSGKTKDTKPEIAREKLKEKRERLKKEKENMIIEEAKKRMLEEEKVKAEAEEKKKKEEDEKRKADPQFILLDKFNELLAAIKPSKIVDDNTPVPKSLNAPKPRKPRAPKKVVEEVIPKEVKPRVSRPRKVESPSNNFVGFDKAPPAPNIVYEQPQQPVEESPVNPLIAHLMGRRNLNTISYM